MTCGAQEARYINFRAQTGRYRSGQTGRTVNPLAYAFTGSNPVLPTIFAKRKVVTFRQDENLFDCPARSANGKGAAKMQSPAGAGIILSCPPPLKPHE